MSYGRLLGYLGIDPSPEPPPRAAENAERDWLIHRTRGYTMSHPIIVTAPGCPTERHPTRDCGCRVFRTEADAREYIAERTAEHSGGAS